MNKSHYPYIILGGGVAGLSTCSFLNESALLLEKQSEFGGLSRSFQMNGVAYDIGPHIIFSKNIEVLDLHTSMIEVNKIKRSNMIFFKGRFVKYPFENDLYALDKEDREFCLQEFLSNPYEDIEVQNMLQFFLKNFGEGITRTYLQPYNEKIWKFDPSCMDTQMVWRIPKPPKEDVINSANGIATEGYTHQLYFYYPKKNGFQELVNAYANKCIQKGKKLLNNINIESIKKIDKLWHIKTESHGEFTSDKIINTMPIHEFMNLIDLSNDAVQSINKLLYNSIYIIMIQVKKDNIGNHFALYFPEKEIIFHRLSKLNFLGENYTTNDGVTTLMAEVTFRPNSYLSKSNKEDIINSVVKDLIKLGFIEEVDIIGTDFRYEKYAYVIYDLNHRKNVDNYLSELKAMGIESVGRFAEFEYLNTDGVVENTMKLTNYLNSLNQ